jgi:hypothetical protein
MNVRRHPSLFIGRRTDVDVCAQQNSMRWVRCWDSLCRSMVHLNSPRRESSPKGTPSARMWYQGVSKTSFGYNF